jgi:ABC-type branched-subunit amino acid transport system substrate-binding protein
MTMTASLTPAGRWRRRGWLTAVPVLALLSTTLVGCGSSSSGAPAKSQASGGVAKLKPASGAVRGFDGTTIRVASLGQKAVFPTLEWGVRARLQRFNDDQEIPGVKIDYVEYADDQGQPAASLSEARRLVTSDGVFGLVGDSSMTNPGSYFAQQKVPYIGLAMDSTYCSSTDKPVTDVWGFSPNGCLTNPSPPYAPDEGRALYDVVSKQSQSTQPTLAFITGDTESGRKPLPSFVAAEKGAGFNVVYAKASVPTGTPVSDYTPYVQELLRSNGGKAPDAIVCRMAVECIQLWAGLNARGYKGAFLHYLYSDQLVKPMAGTYVQTYQPPFSPATVAGTQLKADLAKVKPGLPVDVTAWESYSAADMFVTALKQLAKQGKQYITPENVQKVLSTMTWQVSGVGGPISYPGSTVVATPQCYTLLQSTGTEWKIVAPYKCSTKTFPLK